MTTTSKWVIGIIAGFAVLFILVVGLSFLFFMTASREDDSYGLRGNRIAVIELEGVITESDRVVRQFKKYRESRSIKAIVFRVDSPGGDIVASQEIYEEVRKTRDAGKPVVVSMGSVAASGGYYVSCGASRIVANRGTMTGSIGVISHFLQFEELMSKIGIASVTVQSGKYKDTGSPFRKFSEEDKKYWEQLIRDMYNQFVTVVERERKMPREKVLGLADGRVYSGEQALRLGLVDTLGTYQDAIRIASDLVGIRGKPVIVRERERRRFSLFDLIFTGAKESILAAKRELMEQDVLQYRLPIP